MSVIFNNDEFRISKIKDNEYTISYPIEKQFIISSLNIQELIHDSKQEIFDKSGHETSKDREGIHDTEYTSIFIYSSSIETLPQLLSRKKNLLDYDSCVKLILNIGTQCLQLEEQGLVYPSLDIRNIISLNDGEYFIYLDNTIFKKRENSTFNMNKYVEKTIFSSPELLGTSKIPAILPSVSWIYSLGSIVFHCLTKHRAIHELDEDQLKYEIQHIQDTKLYFCILRMLQQDIYYRVFLFV